MNYLEKYAPLFCERNFPCVPIVKGEKFPRIQNWTHIDFTTDMLLDRAQDGVHESIGIKTGVTFDPGVAFYLIDIDILDPALVQRTLEVLHEKFPDKKFVTRQGKAPKIGIPILSMPGLPKIATGIFKSHLGDKCQVEVLGAGGQFVAYGIHPSTGEEYKWSKPLADAFDQGLPFLSHEEIKGLVASLERDVLDLMAERETRPSNGNAFGQIVHPPVPDFSLDDARDICEVIAENEASYLNEHDDWVKVGMALHHQFEGNMEACDIWDEFSSKSPKYERGECHKRWRSFNASTKGGVTIRALLKLPSVAKFMQEKLELEPIDPDELHDYEIRDDDDRFKAALQRRFAIEEKSSLLYFDMLNFGLLNDKGLNVSYPRPVSLDEDGRPIRRLPASQLLAADTGTLRFTKFGWSPESRRLVYLNGVPCFNTFKGFPYRHTQNDALIKPWLNLCKHVYGDYSNLVLDWMAFAYQNPLEKCQWQILIYGAPRTGKTWAGQIWTRLFGTAGKSVDCDIIQAGWGDPFYQTKALIIEEVKAAGDRRFYNRMKPKFTNDDVETLNIKSQGTVLQKNAYSMMMISNEADALAFNKDDGKVLVLKGPDEQDQDIYDALRPVERQQAFMEAVAYFLKHRDLSTFNARKVIRTKWSDDMSEASRPDWEVGLEEAIEQKQGPFADDLMTPISAILKWAKDEYGPWVKRNAVKELIMRHGYTEVRGQMWEKNTVHKTPRAYVSTSTSEKYPSEKDLYALWLKQGGTKYA